MALYQLEKMKPKENWEAERFHVVQKLLYVVESLETDFGAIGIRYCSRKGNPLTRCEAAMRLAKSKNIEIHVHTGELEFQLFKGSYMNLLAYERDLMILFGHRVDRYEKQYLANEFPSSKELGRL